jgi:hypothetical protein
MSDLDPFITEQDVVNYLGRGTASDPGLIIAVDAACEICRDIAEQPFTRGTSTVTMNGTGSDALVLKNFPVVSAGTVTVNGTAVTNYEVDTVNGMLFRGTVDPQASVDYDLVNYTPPVWPKGRQNVSVTYEHGYTTTDFPRSVKMVALEVASRLVVQGPVQEESQGDLRVKYSVAATDLTAGEKAILRKYRR